MQRLTTRPGGYADSQGWTALTLLWLEESLLEGEPILQQEVSQAPEIDLAILMLHPEQFLPLFPQLFPSIPLIPDLGRLRPPTFLKRDPGADSIIAPLFSDKLLAIIVQHVQNVLGMNAMQHQSDSRALHLFQSVDHLLSLMNGGLLV